jgi:hypothetical protein
LWKEAERVGFEKHKLSTVVFFRNKAVDLSGNDDMRKLFDAWADFFDNLGNSVQEDGHARK